MFDGAPLQAFRKSESESKTTEQYEVRWKIDSDATGDNHGGKACLLPHRH